MFKNLLLLFSSIMIITISLNAQVNGEGKPNNEEVNTNLPSGEAEKEGPIAYRRHRCPRGYCRYCYYWCRDIDASWPSKIEDSFYDYMRN